MLYPRLENQTIAEYQFILDTQPKNDDIDIEKVAIIEQKLLSEVTLEEAKLFLDFMVYNSRIAFNWNSSVNVLDSSFRYQCARMANLNSYLLNKLSLPHKIFNIGEVVCEDKKHMHHVLMLALPIDVDGEVVVKNFLIDPSFRQFFIKDYCDTSAYYGEKKGNINKAAPEPGYFFCLTNQGKVLAESIIRDGYMEMTPENVKCYFDCFKFSTIEKESYSNPMLIGRCCKTNTTFEQYFNLINECSVETGLFPTGGELHLDTATEIINRKNNTLKNRLKNFFMRNNTTDENKNSRHSR